MPYNSFNNFVFKIKSLLKNNIFLDSSEKNYIKHNEKIWKINKNNESKKIIMVDLFHWYPLIHFWSYLTNTIAKKEKAEIRYFYFNSRPRRAVKSNLFLNKLNKIYKSFNVKKGLTSYDFDFSSKEIKNFEKKFKNLKKNKFKLNNFQIDGIKIGDLIYDSYLFETKNFTIDFNDPILKEIFIEAVKIFYSSKKYFKKNKVKYLIPSHVCYTPYGIITRIALKKNVNVVKVKCENWANAFFRLIRIDKNAKIDEQPFYNYRKIFNKFTERKKEEGIKIGHSILKKRISGDFDENLPYMKTNQFKRNNNKLILKIESSKPKVVIFSHCFYDNPHRFRKLFFNDFYEQITFILNLSAKHKKYDWLYKPHPNELSGNLNVHNLFKKKYPSIQLLDKETSHNQIIKMKPKFVLTNHGTIAHEYASFKIPVINTGDNPHVCYNFSLHAQSKSHLKDMILNFDKYKSKINFDKKNIYELLFMHYYFFPNLYNRKKLINDNFFAKKNVKNNHSSSILNYFIKRHASDSNNLKKYIKNFLNHSSNV